MFKFLESLQMKRKKATDTTATIATRKPDKTQHCSRSCHICPDNSLTFLTTFCLRFLSFSELRREIGREIVSLGSVYLTTHNANILDFPLLWLFRFYIIVSFGCSSRWQQTHSCWPSATQWLISCLTSLLGCSLHAITHIITIFANLCPLLGLG